MYKKYWPIIFILISVILLGVTRWLYPERSVTYTGPQGWLDAGFSLGLLGVVLLLSGLLGWQLLTFINLSPTSTCQKSIFALPINIMWGFLIWQEIPTWLTITGAFLTIFSGMYVLYREGKEKPIQVVYSPESTG